MLSRRDIERYVEARAIGRCEYCRMHQSLQGATFHVEHVIPRSRGGHSQLGNLAWAWPSCNLHKANRIDVIDPDTSNQVPQLNPRSDAWHEHFRWDDYRIIGQTPIGRATVAALSSIILDAYKFAMPKSFSTSPRRTRSADNQWQRPPLSTSKKPTCPRSLQAQSRPE
jgi:HNH endonuclease